MAYLRFHQSDLRAAIASQHVSGDKLHAHLKQSAGNSVVDRGQEHLICHVLPRGMRYSRSRATSIDLYVSELIAHSQQSNIVIAERALDPLPAKRMIEMPSYSFA